VQRKCFKFHCTSCLFRYLDCLTTLNCFT
jgi:hypothetical protein